MPYSSHKNHYAKGQDSYCIAHSSLLFLLLKQNRTMLLKDYSVTQRGPKVKTGKEEIAYRVQSSRPVLASQSLTRLSFAPGPFPVLNYTPTHTFNAQKHNTTTRWEHRFHQPTRHEKCFLRMPVHTLNIPAMPCKGKTTKLNHEYLFPQK